MVRDEKLFGLIESEKQRQLHGIELIASENFVSEQVMQAMGSVLTNKYAEGYPGDACITAVAKWWIRWSNWPSTVCASCTAPNTLTCSRTAGSAGEHGRFPDGAQAGRCFYGARSGARRSFVARFAGRDTSGILCNAIGYKLSEETGTIDYDAMERLAALEHKPSMIIGGASSVQPASGITSGCARDRRQSGRAADGRHGAYGGPDCRRAA